MNCCRCIVKQKVKSEANGKSFYVCSLSKGGCGEEILAGGLNMIEPNPTHSNLYRNGQLVGKIDYVSTSIPMPPKGEKVCPECEGGCFTMVCYGGMPYEKSCENCDGSGTVDDDEYM